VHDDDITAVEHTVNGSNRLTEDEVRDYLTAGGYAAEADALIAASVRHGNWHYTADRHRVIHHAWTDHPDGYWTAADSTRGEERIKALGRGRRAGLPLGAFTSEDGRHWR
jgi:hypothetical protein